ncbi:hemophore-related protein [Mycolicibacterium pyrenivorans]|uniref:hemophore-related protein n=1 Tax=Mycolicibacterium pyrenivorans TaxID=187102 RepID=UPI0021F3136C|nr:heme-binding protein [Mycolicibacterium pyrenivorans]
MTVIKGMHDGRVSRRVFGAAAVGVAAGIVAFAGAGAATAQPPPDPCSPAAVMRAHAGAMTRMADYLDSRPDVQQVFIDARSKATPQERHATIRAYVDTHPDVAAAFRDIHQPVMDLSARCGLPMHQGMMPGGMAPGEMGPGGLMPGDMAPGVMAPGGIMPGSMAPGQ